jgi:hypothetical protein
MEWKRTGKDSATEQRECPTEIDLGEAHSQTHFSGRFRLVITSTLPDARAMGIAQQTMRGVERPFVAMMTAVLVGGVRAGRESRERTKKKKRGRR